MHLISYTFATETQAEICATNATAASGTTLVLNGGLSNIGALNSAGYIPRAGTTGMQRTVRVFSTGNISGTTFAFTGVDVNGAAISTSFIGPTGTAASATTAQSTTEFAYVLTASNGTVAATSPFTIGWGASGSTIAVLPDRFENPVIMTMAVVQGNTSGPVTFQKSFINPIVGATPIWNTVTFSSGVSYSSQTAATSVTITENIPALRAILLATAAATGAVQVTFLQSGV